MRYFSRSILLLICLTVLCASFVGAQEKQSRDLFIVIVNDKRGFIDRSGRIVIEPQFRGANNFSEGRAVVAVSNPDYKEGYIDESGKIVIEPKFDAARDFSEGLAAVAIGTFELHGGGEHKWGFVDKSGKMVIELQFKAVRDFSEGLAAVRNNKGLWGFIDKTGKLVVPYKFKNAFEFSEELANVRVKNWGFINHSGNFVIKPKYTFAGKFSEGLAVVKKGGVLVTYEDYTEDSSDENSPEKWMYVDKNGKVVIKLAGNTDSVSKFSEGLASIGIIKKDEILNHGYIDKSGEFVIEPHFGTAEDFSDGVARIITDGSFGFIDKTGGLFFKCKYPSECAMVGDFRNGLASIQQGGEDPWKNFREAKYGYIDKTGKYIWQPTK